MWCQTKHDEMGACLKVAEESQWYTRFNRTRKIDTLVTGEKERCAFQNGYIRNLLKISVYLFIYLFISIFIYLFIIFFIYLFIIFFIYLFISFFIYLFMSFLLEFLILCLKSISFLGQSLYITSDMNRILIYFKMLRYKRISNTTSLNIMLIK